MPDAYLNPSALDYPRDSAGNRSHIPGNAGRRTIEQPGIVNWDMGIVKNTRIGERFNAQFRWEMFNPWDHSQFGTANTSMTSANFGKITGTLIGPRRMQFGLRLVY